MVLLPPCDLHVLATPPAFRLSQDQTLQLFFVDHRILTPDVTALPRLVGTDSFTDGLSSKESLSKPTDLRLIRSAGYCPTAG